MDTEAPPMSRLHRQLYRRRMDRRPIDRMTDVYNARRLLLLWVPVSCARVKWVGWGFCLGRLWVQWTPPTQEEVERRYREKTKSVSAGDY